MTNSSRHSLMRVSGPTGHPYWGTLRQSQIYYANPSSKKNIRVEDKPPYACKPQQFDSESRHGKRSRERAHDRRQRREREKRYGLADPAAWDAINRSLMQQQRLSSRIVTGDLDETTRQKLEGYPRRPTIPSRTTSERKAFNRFTRELEKYANATKAAGKAPITTPTPSESKASYHTVKPLLPYRDELAAAGLAVTSADQKPQSPSKEDDRIPHHKPRLHLDKGVSKGGSVELDGSYDLGREKKPRSDSLSTSSGSIVRFTPPDGFKTHLMEPLPPRPRSKLRPKPKAKPCEKRRLFSWLKRKPPIENNSFQSEPQGGYQLIKDDLIQIYPELVSPSLGPKEHHDTQSQKNAQIQNMQHARNKQLPRKPPLPRDVISPQKPPCTALSLIQCEQRDQGPHPEPQVSKRKRATGYRQPHLSNGPHGQRETTRVQTHLPQTEAHIETIEEEKDTSLSHFHRPTNRCSPRTSRKNKLVPVNMPRQPPGSPSRQTQASSAPSLPFTAQCAVSPTSSLERALDAVSQRFDKMDRLEGDPNGHPAGLVEKTDKSTKIASQQAVDKETTTRSSKSHSARETAKVKKADRTTPLESLAQSDSKPLPPEPTCEAPVAPQTRTSDVPLDEKVESEHARTEQMLKDFDVFLDYDDADIKDRDVIKGLQVAVRAAADDLYDAYIRNKTGLRIRRFLADLKSVDEVQQEIASSTRPAREKRAESRRLQRVQDRNTLHGRGS
ncbi:hypothetical protein F5X96DRAFT_330344 [Biscogniauxia mediterranea]|nr:hypothetical protein F5X96DRAFT_330344 [Biscogniauxia mediterranea]